MKTLSKLVLSGLLVLTAHSVSFANTYTLHLTGATSFRSSATNAIVNYLYAQSGTNPTGAYVGSNVNGASNQVFVGTINSGADTLIVETAWSGSAQGIYDTANGNRLSNAWLSPTANTLTTITHATAPGLVAGGNSLSSPVYLAAAAPDANFSDVWQASTLFPGTSGSTPAETEVVPNGIAVQGYVVLASKPGTSGAQPTGFIANAIPLTLTQGSNIVGASAYVVSQVQAGYTLAPTSTASSPYVPPFAIVTGIVDSTHFSISVAAGGATGSTGTVPVSIAYDGWSNVNTEQLRALYTDGSGTLPLSQFTGAPGDNGGLVIGIGRSPDSGTRVAFTEEIGIHNETSGSQVYQIAPFDSNGNLITNSTTQVASVAPLPATTLDGVALAAGDNGYTSSSQISAVLDNPTLYNVRYNYFFVSPLGVSDATNAVKGGATALTFNGEPYNQVYLEQGKYPLWSYEHLYTESASGQILTSAQAIANQIASSDGVINGDLISNLSVYRSPLTVDGAAIFNYATPPALH